MAPRLALAEQRLRALVAWLDAQDVPIVAMESTGVYWKAVYPAIRTLTLLSPSFVPDVALLELRGLTRYRKKRIGEQASERNRIIKLLEASNVRLASVASDPLGKAGRAIIEALLVGEQTAEQIAQTAGRKLRTPTHDIARAIDGVVTDTTRFLLGQMLGHIDQVAKLRDSKGRVLSP